MDIYVLSVEKRFRGDAMTINNVPVYLIKYEWGGDMDLEQVSSAVHSIAEKIQSINPDAEWVSMPTEMSLEKIDVETLKCMYDELGNYINSVIARHSDLEEEEET